MEMKFKESFAVLAFLILHLVNAEVTDIRLPPTIVTSPIEHKTFRIEDNLELECVASGVPKPEYHWKKNGEDLTGFGGRLVHTQEGSFRIPQLSPIDEGVYQCFANNQYGVALSRKVVLERAILWSYTFNGVIEHRVINGQPHTLQCHPTKCFPKPIFSWAVVDDFIDVTEKPVVSGKRIQMDEDGNLHFAYVTPADAQGGKLYKCELWNPILDITIGGSYAKLIVSGSGAPDPFVPRISFVSKSPVIALEGKDLKLRCFFSGNESPSIRWSKLDGTRSLPVGRYTILNFNTELLIKGVVRTDAGVYACTAQNSLGISEQTITVDVQAEPRFMVTADQPHNINVTEGDTAFINCSAHAIPEATVTWMKNGEPLSVNAMPRRFRLSEDGKTLIIRDLCRNCQDGSSDLMVIQCEAKNMHGYAFANGYINVLGIPPTFSATPANISSVDGRNVTLECSAEGLPKPVITWRIEGRNQSLFGHRFQQNSTGSLEIINVTETDTDTYVCLAVNTLGTQQAKAKLTVTSATSVTTPVNGCTLDFGTECPNACGKKGMTCCWCEQTSNADWIYGQVQACNCCPTGFQCCGNNASRPPKGGSVDCCPIGAICLGNGKCQLTTPSTPATVEYNNCQTYSHRPAAVENNPKAKAEGNSEGTSREGDVSSEGN